MFVSKWWLLPLLTLAPSLAGNTAMADIRGASSDVKGSISDVSQNAQKVFNQMGITTTQETATSPLSQKTIEGTKGEMDVTVQMRQNGENQTHVDVIAKQGTLKWNKDYAQNVLSKIVQTS